jgi:Secretin and TonB N terminus short domain
VFGATERAAAVAIPRRKSPYMSMRSSHIATMTTQGLLSVKGGLMRVALLGTAVWLSTVGLCLAQDAQASIRKPTNIPAQELASALQMLGRERGVQVVYRSDVVGNIQTQGAVGELSVDEAVAQLLKGTRLTYHHLDDKTVTIVPMATGSQDASPPTAIPVRPVQQPVPARRQVPVLRARGRPAVPMTIRCRKSSSPAC